MIDWDTTNLVGFDTETTGTNTATDRIVTCSIISRIADNSETYTNWIINPQVDIPPAATAVHGITTEYAKAHGQNPVKALEEIVNTLVNFALANCPLLAYNATFDFSILEADLKRNNLPTLRERLANDTLLIIDPLVIDRKLNKYRRGPRKLENLIQAYQLPVRNFHNAQADVLALLDLWQAMLHEHPEISNLNNVELMNWQKQAHVQWANDFENYLRRNGNTTTFISRDWPFSDANN